MLKMIWCEDYVVIKVRLFCEVVFFTSFGVCDSKKNHFEHQFSNRIIYSSTGKIIVSEQMINLLI